MKQKEPVSNTTAKDYEVELNFMKDQIDRFSNGRWNHKLNSSFLTVRGICNLNRVEDSRKEFMLKRLSMEIGAVKGIIQREETNK